MACPIASWVACWGWTLVELAASNGEHVWAQKEALCGIDETGKSGLNWCDQVETGQERWLGAKKKLNGARRAAFRRSSIHSESLDIGSSFSFTRLRESRYRFHLVALHGLQDSQRVWQPVDLKVLHRIFSVFSSFSRFPILFISLISEYNLKWIINHWMRHMGRRVASRRQSEPPFAPQNRHQPNSGKLQD